MWNSPTSVIKLKEFSRWCTQSACSAWQTSVAWSYLRQTRVAWSHLRHRSIRNPRRPKPNPLQRAKAKAATRGRRTRTTPGKGRAVAAQTDHQPSRRPEERLRRRKRQEKGMAAMRTTCPTQNSFQYAVSEPRTTKCKNVRLDNFSQKRALKISGRPSTIKESLQSVILIILIIK